MIPIAAESLSRIADTLYRERVQNAGARPRPEPDGDAHAERGPETARSGRRHRQ